MHGCWVSGAGKTFTVHHRRVPNVRCTRTLQIMAHGVGVGRHGAETSVESGQEIRTQAQVRNTAAPHPDRVVSCLRGRGNEIPEHPGRIPPLHSFPKRNCCSHQHQHPTRTGTKYGTSFGGRGVGMLLGHACMGEEGCWDMREKYSKMVSKLPKWCRNCRTSEQGSRRVP